MLLFRITTLSLFNVENRLEVAVCIFAKNDLEKNNQPNRNKVQIQCKAKCRCVASNYSKYYETDDNITGYKNLKADYRKKNQPITLESNCEYIEQYTNKQKAAWQFCK